MQFVIVFPLSLLLCYYQLFPPLNNLFLLWIPTTHIVSLTSLSHALWYGYLCPCQHLSWYTMRPWRPRPCCVYFWHYFPFLVRLQERSRLLPRFYLLPPRHPRSCRDVPRIPHLSHSSCSSHAHTFMLISQHAFSQRLKTSGIYVNVWLSPFTAHLKLSQHC